MCEMCEANRERYMANKRAGTDALLAEPASGSLAERALSEVGGFSAFLEIGRRLEAIARDDGEGVESTSPAAKALMEMIAAMTPAGRTDVLVLSKYLAELTRGIAENVARIKVFLDDPDVTKVDVQLEGRTVVARVNGVEVRRIELDSKEDAEAAIDAAERAMQAHRTQYHGDE